LRRIGASQKNILTIYRFGATLSFAKQKFRFSPTAYGLRLMIVNPVLNNRLYQRAFAPAFLFPFLKR
jgi:hypothetical protein